MNFQGRHGCKIFFRPHQICSSTISIKKNKYHQEYYWCGNFRDCIIKYMEWPIFCTMPLYYTLQTVWQWKMCFPKEIQEYFQEQAEVFYAPSAIPKGMQQVSKLWWHYTMEYLGGYKYYISLSTNSTSHFSSYQIPQLLCIHLQVQEWKGHGSEFQSLEWGWKECAIVYWFSTSYRWSIQDNKVATQIA